LAKKFRKVRDEKGRALFEYALVLVQVSIAVFVVLGGVGE